MTERPRLYPTDSRIEEELWQAAAPHLPRIHQEILRLELWLKQRSARTPARARRVRVKSR